MKQRSRKRRGDRIEAAYDAAQTTPENRKHWRWADGLSATEANSPEVRRVIRERARYERGSNAFAAGIVQSVADAIIGTGPRAQIRTGRVASDRIIEQRWHQWCDQIHLARKLRTAVMARVTDGEVFMQRGDNPRLQRSRIDQTVTLDIQLVECDRFENMSSAWIDEKHVSGIRFDDFGNPVEYDLLEYHPGDTFGAIRQSSPVDADDIIHLFRGDRPGQIRGVSELTPAIPLFAKLRRYTLAVIMAAEVAADHAAVLSTQAPPLTEDGEFDGDDVDPFDAVEIDRGMMVSLPRGWRMDQFKPEQPTTTYEMFRNAILAEIARCLCVPFNVALGSSEGYNYASGQLDHGSFDDRNRIERKDLAIEVLDRIFGWWLDEASLIEGYLPPIETGQQITARWYWPGRTHGDPVKQANAVSKLRADGLMTDEAYLLGEGIDPEEHHEQRIRQAQREAELLAISGPAATESVSRTESSDRQPANTRAQATAAA